MEALRWAAYVAVLLLAFVFLQLAHALHHEGVHLRLNGVAYTVQVSP